MMSNRFRVLQVEGPSDKKFEQKSEVNATEIKQKMG